MNNNRGFQGEGLEIGVLVGQRQIVGFDKMRRHPTNGSVQPWPWSFNAAGEGRYMASRAEAVAEVQARQAAGTRSIDIGCMQINLLHHPDAFESVEAGFDPETNPNVLSDRHVGLKIMRERAHRVGAECLITSRPGVGTQVSLTLAA